MLVAFVLFGTKIFIGFVLQSLQKACLLISDDYIEFHLFSLHPAAETSGLLNL